MQRPKLICSYGVTLFSFGNSVVHADEFQLLHADRGVFLTLQYNGEYRTDTVIDDTRNHGGEMFQNQRGAAGTLHGALRWQMQQESTILPKQILGCGAAQTDLLVQEGNTAHFEALSIFGADVRLPAPSRLRVRGRVSLENARLQAAQGYSRSYVAVAIRGEDVIEHFAELSESNESVQFDQILTLEAGNYRVEALAETFTSLAYFDNENLAPTGRYAMIVSMSTCVADLNVDQTVDVTDLARLLDKFGEYIDCSEVADLNFDWRVDLADLTMMLSEFGTACE